MDKGVHTFANAISPIVNIIVRPEFKLTHYDVKYVNYFAKGIDLDRVMVPFTP